jgi:hypothetical protein
VAGGVGAMLQLFVYAVADTNICTANNLPAEMSPATKGGGPKLICIFFCLQSKDPGRCFRVFNQPFVSCTSL